MQMRAKGVRFSWQLRFWFYNIFGVLFLSGILWWGMHYLTLSNETMNETFGWLKPWLMRIHGATAMASLIMLGFLIPRHMQRGWAQDRNRLTAVGLVSGCLFLILSGYGLYYCGDETLRAWLSSAHSASGVLLPMILVWHIISGRAQK
jgi:hypothetical protein